MSLPIVCCACGADMGTDPRDFPPLPDGTMPAATHGLCAKCVEKAEREYGLENPKARNVGLMVVDGAPCYGRAHRAGSASPDLNPLCGGHEVEPGAVEEPCLSGNGARPGGKSVSLKATATEYRGADPFPPLTLAGNRGDAIERAAQILDRKGEHEAANEIRYSGR